MASGRTNPSNEAGRLDGGDAGTAPGPKPFTLVARSTLFADPVVRKAATAVAADDELMVLRRVCGRYCTVDIIDPRGRPMSAHVLQSRAKVERAMGAATTPPAGNPQVEP